MTDVHCDLRQHLHSMQLLRRNSSLNRTRAVNDVSVKRESMDKEINERSVACIRRAGGPQRSRFINHSLEARFAGNVLLPIKAGDESRGKRCRFFADRSQNSAASAGKIRSVAGTEEPDILNSSPVCRPSPSWQALAAF